MLTPEQFNSIGDTINNVNLKKIEEMTDEDRLEAARKALHTMREYQILWQDHGSDRVHQVYDDVEGNWLKDFAICVPNETTIAAMNEDRDTLETIEADQVGNWLRRLSEEALSDDLGVDVGEAE
jgi:hypothetical protein